MLLITDAAAAGASVAADVADAVALEVDAAVADDDVAAVAAAAKAIIVVATRN
jgi:hypothetical protein